ncbi:MAG: class I SAM-dependent methyltransferase [Eubacteriales bacterium]|nr:class I SAM-dependent methyltransferase [Eubacteriales bacterium]
MANEKQKSKKAFNQQAATYDQDMRGQHARSLYPILLEKLSDISYHSALDLGCGTGEMIKRILEQDAQKALTGIDLSEKMLKIAKGKLNGRAKLLLGDSEHLPFQDGTFDVVYCNDSFHHYPAPENVLAEVKRVLKTGGLFLMGDCWQPFIGRTIMNFYMKHSNEGDVKIYSEQEIRFMFEKYFINVQWEQAGKTACIAWGEKSDL